MDATSGAHEAKAAEPVSENELTEEQFLKAYKKKEYPKPSLTADIAVFRRVQDGVEVLMIRRGRHPYQGCWALPGGFVDPNEDVEDAARRELEEETGIVDVPIEPFGIYGTPGRDPRGWTVSGGFCALVEEGVGVRAGDDAADARWCKVVESADMPQESGCDLRALGVECGNGESLAVRFEIVEQRFSSPRARVVESVGFAFDHARLLADAYLMVTRGRAAW